MNYSSCEGASCQRMVFLDDGTFLEEDWFENGRVEKVLITKFLQEQVNTSNIVCISRFCYFLSSFNVDLVW